MEKQNCELNVVKQGIFLYDELVECDIRIVFSKIHYGTGDYEDPPEIANDIERDTFYLQYGSTTQCGVYTASSGGFPSVEAAIKAAESAIGIGNTIKWL